jgi:hypothetical protein
VVLFFFLEEDKIEKRDRSNQQDFRGQITIFILLLIIYDSKNKGFHHGSRFFLFVKLHDDILTNFLIDPNELKLIQQIVN